MGFIVKKQSKRVSKISKQNSKIKMSKTDNRIMTISNFTIVSEAELMANRCSAYSYVM